MIYIILLYNNLITGNIFIYSTEFIELNKDNLMSLIMTNSGITKTNISLNNSHKKYDYETDVMKYIGYISLNNEEEINIIKNQINKLFNNDNKLICLNENYIHVNYEKMIKYCKKECLIYKIKLLNYFKIYDKITIELMNNIYIKLFKKYYKIKIERNFLDTILFKK